MTDREEIENLLVDVRRRRDEAEAEASNAMHELARLASGITPLPQVDTDQVRATADTFADAAVRLRELQTTSRQLRSLLL